MGRTYRKEGRDFDEKHSGRNGKHHGHSNNKKSGGMRVINNVYENDDFFQDEVEITDQIELYINGEKVT